MDMKRKFKIKRNDLCPCGSGKKYKYCCEEKVDWEQLIKEGKDRIPYLSIRGRNYLFIQKIAEALQLDSAKPPESLDEYKKAITPKAVTAIHEAIIKIWPKELNIQSILEKCQTDVSGLYIGYYSEKILEGIIRHSIYANKIIVVDPFIYPYSVKEEYNPISSPEEYRTQTLRNINFWFRLAPWIEAGIVEIIRTPDDFDHKLKWDSNKRQYKKFEENKELYEIAEKTISGYMETKEVEDELIRDFVLSIPNEYLEKIFKEIDLDKNNITFEEFMSYINKMRAEDPDFLEPMKAKDNIPQFLIHSSGASYDIAKMTANITDSYLVTDIKSRWKEIEIDRKNQNIEIREWSPFAKAIQNLELKYLNNIELKHALTLRKENRLESLRVFLQRVWKSACSGEPFNEINAKFLADELNYEIRKAEAEWKKIDRDLLKWFGSELIVAGKQILTGSGYFLPAMIALMGIIKLGTTQLERKSFQDKFPAAFFMKIK